MAMSEEMMQCLRENTRKLDRLLVIVEELQKDVTKLETDHETRLRSLERKQWPLPSAMFVIALLALIPTYLTMVN